MKLRGEGNGKAYPNSTILRESRKKTMHEELMEEIVQTENAQEAMLAVKANKGAPGIDRMSTEELPDHLRENWPKIKQKLLEGTYVPTPVRRVEIPKPNGGKRMLGIPTVQDRFIQQMLLQTLTKIFDPKFSPNSYGFRPNKSAQEAVKAAQKQAEEGRRWVVDMDITKFFDHVNHDILMNQIAKEIRDKRVLRLIGKYLRAGAMLDGIVVASEEGTPQGGPLSPLLANIYLDMLDKELERRNHAYSRYADDCNIYVRSEKAAGRVLESITKWIKKNLRLDVNAEKSGYGKVSDKTKKFLGFRLNYKLEIVVAEKAIEKFKGKIKELWDRNQGKSSKDLRDQWKKYVTGWWAYFKLAGNRRPIFDLEPWIRRHIRACFWKRWHSAQGRRSALRKLGIKNEYHLGVAWSKKGAWSISKHSTIQMALSNAVLRKYGFIMPSNLAET